MKNDESFGAAALSAVCFALTMLWIIDTLELLW